MIKSFILICCHAIELCQLYYLPHILTANTSNDLGCFSVEHAKKKKAIFWYEPKSKNENNIKVKREETG
jgi:hypothetical protein